MNGRAEVVRLLLSKSDIDINKAKDTGATALHVASQNNHIVVVELLLSKSEIDINRVKKDGATSLYMELKMATFRSFEHF